MAFGALSHPPNLYLWHFGLSPIHQVCVCVYAVCTCFSFQCPAWLLLPHDTHQVTVSHAQGAGGNAG